MIGKWDHFGWAKAPAVPPADDFTFRLGAQFLDGLPVEDWGCGVGYFSTLHDGFYRGVDGSATPAVHAIHDLTTYTSSGHNIFMRHVLEHNWSWERVLFNALHSFHRRMVLVLFTPWADEVQAITVSDGIPDLSLVREEVVRHLAPFWWASRENLVTDTQYKIEHVFFVERP